MMSCRDIVENEVSGLRHRLPSRVAPALKPIHTDNGKRAPCCSRVLHDSSNVPVYIRSAVWISLPDPTRDTVDFRGHRLNFRERWKQVY